MGVDFLKFDTDAFADGQIGSKIWLCEELERLEPRFSPRPLAWIFGGWYGLAAFLLLARGRLAFKGVVSFDLDPAATRVAGSINNNWRIGRGCFKAVTADCGRPELWREEEELPDIVINTACEHFMDASWWNQIPSGTWVALQATDQGHAPGESVCLYRGIGELKAKHPFREIAFEGAKEFRYTERSFRRFMLIGKKG